MLVISRKRDEGIFISDDIKIVVLETGRDRVKIGIDAPRNIIITREEMYYTEKTNIAAAENVPSKRIMDLLLNRTKSQGEIIDKFDSEDNID